MIPPRYLVMTPADARARTQGSGYSYVGYDTMPWWRRLRVWVTGAVLVDQSTLVDRLYGEL